MVVKENDRLRLMLEREKRKNRRDVIEETDIFILIELILERIKKNK